MKNNFRIHVLDTLGKVVSNARIRLKFDSDMVIERAAEIILDGNKP